MGLVSVLGLCIVVTEARVKLRLENKNKHQKQQHTRIRTTATRGVCGEHCKIQDDVVILFRDVTANTCRNNVQIGQCVSSYIVQYVQHLCDRGVVIFYECHCK